MNTAEVVALIHNADNDAADARDDWRPVRPHISDSCGTTVAYALDAEGHGPDCAWRHEGCDNGEACITNVDRLHECDAAGHWNYA